MIIDLEDYVQSDVLPVIKDKSINHLIIKRDFNDFILVDANTFIYSKIERVNTSKELEDLGIFPRKGEQTYTWSEYKQLIDNRKNEEIIKPF